MDGRRSAHTDRDGNDEVTEAGLESFPASDPPAFNQSGPKPAEENTTTSDERPAPGAEHRQAPDDREPPRHTGSEHEPAPMPNPVRRPGIGKPLINGAIIAAAVLIALWLAFG